MRPYLGGFHGHKTNAANPSLSNAWYEFYLGCCSRLVLEKGLVCIIEDHHTRRPQQRQTTQNWWSAKHFASEVVANFLHCHVCWQILSMVWPAVMACTACRFVLLELLLVRAQMSKVHFPVIFSHFHFGDTHIKTELISFEKVPVPMLGHLFTCKGPQWKMKNIFINWQFCKKYRQWIFNKILMLFWSNRYLKKGMMIAW